MVEIKAPNKVPIDGRFTVFFAGSIEMGSAENWQERLKDMLSNLDIIIMNPRRDDWDSSWEQKITNPQFREQVEWELECLDRADLIVVYFDGGTKSPITLMELGLHARYGKSVVYCPDNFWRKGNVDVVCNKYGVPQVDSIDGLAAYINNWFKINL